MSKVNFIFWSRSPMKMEVKFLINDYWVTYSSFLAFELSRDFFPGDNGEIGELLEDPMPFYFFILPSENITCSLSFIIPGSFVYSMKVTLSI